MPKPKTPKTLGARLQEARKRKKLTQAAVAKKLDCWVQEVSSWEASTTPTAARLAQLAKLYGVTVESLVGAVTA